MKGNQYTLLPSFFLLFLRLHLQPNSSFPNPTSLPSTSHSIHHPQTITVHEEANKTSPEVLMTKEILKRNTCKSIRVSTMKPSIDRFQITPCAHSIYCESSGITATDSDMATAMAAAVGWGALPRVNMAYLRSWLSSVARKAASTWLYSADDAVLFASTILYTVVYAEASSPT